MVVLGWGLTPIQRCSQCILQPLPTGQYGLFDDKAILVEQLWYNLTHNWGNKGVYAFPKIISLKVNVIEQLVFELTNYSVATQHVSQYAMRTSPEHNGRKT